MKTTFLTLILLVLTIQFASAEANVVGKFCSNQTQSNFAKKRAENYSNLLYFNNQGGFFGVSGVCWWHSRFQRNALYLTAFDPSAPRPTDEEAKQIIRDIRNGAKIIVIPGFSDFYHFSLQYGDEILNELEGWQKRDSVRFAWINGIKGKSSVKAEKLKQMMDELYNQVEVNNEIVYQKLQLKGIVAHSWLVVSMKKTDIGYSLGVLDSNFPLGIDYYKYEEGMTHFEYHDWGPFVPYTENNRELKRIKSVVAKTCQ